MVLGLGAVGRWAPSVVMTGSMSPGLDTGDVILAQAHPDVDDLGVGSVVVFPDPVDRSLTVTHRIVAIDEASGYFQTKGDANDDPDSAWLDPDDVIAEGKAMVPYIGLPAVWYHRGELGRFAAFVVVLTAAIWVSRWCWLHRFDPWRPSQPGSNPAQ